jgi:hypothetical protein
MPELRRYVCDHPANDGVEGRVFHIQVGRVRRKVILCPDHAAQLETVMSWGMADDPTPLTARATRGLNTERLRELIVEEELPDS